MRRNLRTKSQKREKNRRKFIGVTKQLRMMYQNKRAQMRLKSPKILIKTKTMLIKIMKM